MVINTMKKNKLGKRNSAGVEISNLNTVSSKASLKSNIWAKTLRKQRGELEEIWEHHLWQTK